MEQIKAYENFPARLVIVSVLVNVAIYVLGTAILSGYGPLMAGLYLLYCLGNEVHIMRTSCVDCYYYGKWCALGKGKIAPLFFKKGDPPRFTEKDITWKELVPDMLVLIFPLAGGGILLLRDLSWGMSGMLAGLLALSFGGNYLVRSRIACKFCKQREPGCPAEQLFSRR